MNILKNIHKSTCLLLSGIMFSFGLSLTDTTDAYAEPTSKELKEQSSKLKDELATIQLDLEKASDTYNRILIEKDSAEQAATEAQDGIDEAEEKLNDLQDKIAVRVKDMYRNDDLLSSISMLLDARSIEDAIQTLTYLESVNRSDVKMVEDSRALKEETEAKQTIAQEQESLAYEKGEEARQVKEQTEAKIEEYEEKIADLDEKAQQKAREEAAAAAAQRALSYSRSATVSSTPIPANGDVVDYAYSRLGCPYVWAASGPNSFDCSGLVMWCYAQVGISLPHNSEALYSAAAARIPVSQAEPGDVLYRSGHVGICIAPGGGQYIHAPTSGDVVRIASWSMWSCALRF